MKFIKSYIILYLLLLSVISCSNTLILSKKVTVSNNWIFKSFKKHRDIFAKSTRYEFSNPVIDGNAIYWGSSSGIFYSIEKESGKKRWEFTAAKRIDCEASFNEKRVFFVDIGGNLYALDKNSGKLIWKCKIDGFFFTKPILRGNSIILFDSANKVIAIDETCGKFLWQVTHEIKSDKLIKGGFVPFFHNDTLYVGFIDGSLSQIKPESGEEILSTRLIASEGIFQEFYLPSLLYKNSLFVPSESSGILSLNIETLAPNWSYNPKSAPTTGPIISDFRVYFATQNRKIICLNKELGTLIWEREIPIRAIPMTISILNNVLFLGLSRGDILVYNSIDGRLITKIPVGSGVSSNIISDNHDLIFASNMGNLYSVKNY